VTHTRDDQTCDDVSKQTGSALSADFRNGSTPAGPMDTAAGLERVPTGAAVLVVKRGPNAGSQFRLDQPVTSAGRHLDSDIVLDHITVSRYHAEFRCERGEFRVVDVGSLNGTYVNREPIHWAMLTDGDEIQIGKVRLVFWARP
jgi:pSer/pThr/pTyr-binding forkhead associated (FHA) protein